MQSARVVFLMIIFAVMAIGAYAQTCPPATTTPAAVCPTCPTAVCPTLECPTCKSPTCPKVNGNACGNCGPTTCPTGECGSTVCPQPVAVIAPPSCAMLGGMGGGPLAILDTTCAGPDFDRLYIENMYQLHTDITALTTQGIEQVSDRSLRNLSGKIRTEQSDQNTKLSQWYQCMGLGRVQVDYCKSGNIINCLTKVCGPEFDAVYAQTLSDSLKTLRDSSLVAAPKLSTDEMRNQANLVARVSQNEINVLQRWIAQHGTVPVVP